jgi:hypothetical protein
MSQTIDSYDEQGGFRREFASIRAIGEHLTYLRETIPARPHREPEITALKTLVAAVDSLREEIAKTINL